MSKNIILLIAWMIHSSATTAFSTTPGRNIPSSFVIHQNKNFKNSILLDKKSRTSTIPFSLSAPSSLSSHHNNHVQRTILHAVDIEEVAAAMNTDETMTLIGDDSAAFSLEEQKLGDWVKFTAATGTVLALVSYLWFLPWGPHLGNTFLSTVQNTIQTTSPDVTIFTMLTIFGIVHSGLAGLRPYAETIVGARIWRVLFAFVSLPLALSCISYFINHCHEGIQLWNIQQSYPDVAPFVHGLCWLMDFVSFLFLYPSTFNLLEIAAIEKPQLHLWETGVIRITRHPQAMGQIMWCLAHSLWLGTSTTLAASFVLVAHHLYSVWHGDRRLAMKHGEKFDMMKERTSVVPFQAILEGRQVLPDDYYREFLRGPYLLVVGGTLAAYFAHPWMMAGAALLKW